MSKIVEVVRVVMNKSWTGNEQEMKNNEKVLKKCTTHGQVVNKLWTSYEVHEQVINE